MFFFFLYHMKLFFYYNILRYDYKLMPLILPDTAVSRRPRRRSIRVTRRCPIRRRGAAFWAAKQRGATTKTSRFASSVAADLAPR